MNPIKKFYFYITTFKSIFITGLILSLNFFVASVFADFNSPHIDMYVIQMVKSNTPLDIVWLKNDSVKSNDKLMNISFWTGLDTISNWQKFKNSIKTEPIAYINSVLINIPKIGVYQQTFLMKFWDIKSATDIKSDKDIIDMELNDFFNIDSWFFIWGHSSGYWWDKSDKKEIFKDLEKLNIWDSIFIEINTTKGKIVKKYTVSDRVIWKDLKLDKTDKIVYTCYPYNTSSERLVLKLK